MTREFARRVRPGLVALLGLTVAASLTMLGASSPVSATAGDTGPAIVPLTDTSSLALTSGEWNSNN